MHLLGWISVILADARVWKLPSNKNIRSLDDYFAWVNTATPDNPLNQAIVCAANPMGILGIVVFVCCLRAIRDDLGRKTVVFFFLLWVTGYVVCVSKGLVPAYFGAISGAIAVLMFVMSKVMSVVDR